MWYVLGYILISLAFSVLGVVKLKDTRVTAPVDTAGALIVGLAWPLVLTIALVNKLLKVLK